MSDFDTLSLSMKKGELTGTKAVAACVEYNSTLPVEVGTKFLLFSGEYAILTALTDETVGYRGQRVILTMDWGFEPHTLCVNLSGIIKGSAYNPYTITYFNRGCLGEGFFRSNNGHGHALHLKKWKELMRRLYASYRMPCVEGMHIDRKLLCFANYQKILISRKLALGFYMDDELSEWELSKDVVPSILPGYRSATLHLVPEEIDLFFRIGSEEGPIKNIAYNPRGYFEVSHNYLGLDEKRGRVRTKVYVNEELRLNSAKIALDVCGQQRLEILKMLRKKYSLITLDQRVLDAMKDEEGYLKRFIYKDEEEQETRAKEVLKLTHLSIL